MRKTNLSSLALILLLAVSPVAMSNSPLTQPAQALVTHAPHYPGPAIDRGLEGVVKLRVEIEASGEPANISVESKGAHPILRDAAIRSVKRWTFSPALSDGEPVSSTLEIPIRFELLAERSYRSSVMHALPYRVR